MQINYATIATTYVDIWNKLKLIKNELWDFFSMQVIEYSEYFAGAGRGV